MFMRKSFLPKVPKGKEKGSRVQASTLRFDPTSPNLPLGYEKCIEFLEQHIKEPGIFRLSGSSSQLSELKAKLLKLSRDTKNKSAIQRSGKRVPSVGSSSNLTGAAGGADGPGGSNQSDDPNDISYYDPHVVSGCLKLFLREMEEPICTFELYDCWLSAVLPFREARVACVRKLLTFLPLGHTVLLQRICCLLRKVSLHSDVNKMNASNLAIVFAPTFFRRDGESMEEMVADQETLLALVKHLINDYEYIFEDKPIPPESLAAGDENPDCPPPSPRSSVDDDASSLSTSTDATTGALGNAGGGGSGRKATSVAIALWDHEALTGAELSFKALDLILVEETETENNEFWFGSLMSQSASRGYFQRAYVQVLDASLRIGQATVNYTFSADNPELLSCAVGDLFIIEPTCAHDDWFEADLPVSNLHGLLPCSFVNIVFPASNSRAPPRRLNQLKQAGNFYKRLSRIDAVELARRMAEIGSQNKNGADDDDDDDDDDEPSNEENNTTSTSSAASLTESDDVSAATSTSSTPNQPDETAAAAQPDSPKQHDEESAQEAEADAGQQQASEGEEAATSSSAGDGKRVIGLFSYSAETSPPELSFEKDDVMVVINVQSSGWLEVELRGQVGLVPSTYVAYL